MDEDPKELPKLQFSIPPFDDWDEAPKSDVKLCKIADPDCEACQ